MGEQCLLCGSTQTAFYFEDKKRPYLQCQCCDLVFVPPQFHLSELDEKAEYDKHENDIDDTGYQQFLSRVSKPLVSKLIPGAKGLDFGCGPAPALAHMLTEHDFEMSLYDLFYFPDISVLAQDYDFITCTEVIEHIANPMQTFELFKSLLSSDGVIAIMTKRVINVEKFKHWHYKNDPTHIAFYSERTFEYLASKFEMTLNIVDNDVVFLTPVSSED